jgi:hypothetical protein
MSKPLTKTFTETRYWRKLPSGELTRWSEVPRSQTGEIALDAQVAEWVARTGATIMHPGQVGIFSSWLDPEMTLRCTLIGLVVLYVEAELPHGKPEPYQAPGGARPDYGLDAGGADEAGQSYPAPQPASAFPTAPDD